MRLGISDLVSHHHDTFTSKHTSRRHILAVLYGPAVVVSLGATAGRVFAPNTFLDSQSLGTSLATALAFIAGVLFGVGLTALDKAIDLDMAGPTPSKYTDSAADRLAALAANTLFTSCVAGVGTAAVITGELISCLQRPSLIAGLAAFVLVGTNGAFIVGRVFDETMNRTMRAKSGASLGSPDAQGEEQSKLRANLTKRGTTEVARESEPRQDDDPKKRQE